MIIKDRTFQGKNHKHLSISDKKLTLNEDILIQNCTFKDATEDMIWICASYQDIGIVTIKDCTFDGWWIADRSHPDAVQTFQDKGKIKEVRIINCRTRNTDHQAFFIDAQRVWLEGNWCRQGDVVITPKTFVHAYRNSFESGFRYKGNSLILTNNVIKWCKLANSTQGCHGNYVHYNWGSFKLPIPTNTRLTKAQYNETIKAGLPPAKDAGYILYQPVPEPEPIAFDHPAIFPEPITFPETLANAFSARNIESVLGPEPPAPEPPAPDTITLNKAKAKDFYNELGQALVEED